MKHIDLHPLNSADCNEKDWVCHFRDINCACAALEGFLLTRVKMIETSLNTLQTFRIFLFYRLAVAICGLLFT